MPDQTTDASTKPPKTISIQQVRDAIPPECFRSSPLRSFGSLSRDLLLVFALLAIATKWADKAPTGPGICLAWLVYGAAQGTMFTGLWVIGHECGHGAFASSQVVNNMVGFFVHTVLLTPYFSWQSTHRRHHNHCGHIDKDANHVPLRAAEYRASFMSALEEYGEDAPAYVLGRLILQQVLGWQLYLFQGLTSGSQCYACQPSGRFFENSHFNPVAAMFRPSEFSAVVLSDLGVALAIAGLLYAGQSIGWWHLFLLYGLPYLWLNQAIVVLTFLQHTDPSVGRYEDEHWTFAKGATSTIDRDLGFVCREFFHNVANYHVVHHLFPRIPFYHAQQATEAIKPLLGPRYLATNDNLFRSLWTVYKQCQWVAPGLAGTEEYGSLRFHTGRVPPLGIARFFQTWVKE